MTFSSNLQSLLQHGDIASQLKSIHRGIEREALRVSSDGAIAQTAHPAALGSPLTHQFITTDFSEALLEFITPVATSLEEAMEKLKTIHQFTDLQLGNEILWPSSMPCQLGDDDAIPVARYGKSNVANMKTVYRLGLGQRYGRRMQTIAGVHYNFSLPPSFWLALQKHYGNHEPLQTFIDNQYFALIRNFRRYYWLLVYLFGASPAVSRSFIGDRAHALCELDSDTLYLPHSTSLRMGDLGYQSKAQEALFVCYNHLDTYIETLGRAIHQPYPAYEAIGTKHEGEYRQLSTGLLQIENEFYSPIRPKRVAKSGETPLHALQRGGIEYIEVRCLDVDPFHPLGISEDTIRFVDCFLLMCLLHDSPLCDMAEFGLTSENQRRVVMHGREPDVQVSCGKEEIHMRDCARTVTEGLSVIADTLDRVHGGTSYRDSLTLQLDKINHTEKTPSARMLEIMQTEKQSFHDFSVQQATAHRQALNAVPLTQETIALFEREARESLQRQEAIEAQDTMSFDEYLEQYFQHASRTVAAASVAE